tara:strand:+ start:40 stop:774 length:735 start_codon:yes stop_codon:yes gene_type:complete
MKKLLLLLIVPFLSFGQNLILNPGFETASTGMPTGDPLPSYPNTLNNWTAVNTDGEFMFDLELANTGYGFLSVLQNAGQNQGLPWLGYGNYGGYDRAGQLISVLPSTEYSLQFWCRYGDGSRYGYGAGDLIVELEETLPTNNSFVSQVITPSSDWEMVEFTFFTGDNCEELILLFSPQGPNNTDIWIDDVSITVPHGSYLDSQCILTKTLLKKVNLIGIETSNNNGFQLHIYDDGSVEKKYVIK